MSQVPDSLIREYLLRFELVTNSQRIIFNTAALYGKMAVTTVFVLFSSRLVLAALGVVDFGLYSVIAGIMAFMAFLNLAMATSSQRHLTYALGQRDFVQLNRIFNTCIGLHLALTLLLVLLGETIGVWFLHHVLNIPGSRRIAAYWIYQFTVISTASYVIAVPYQALLTAHEALVAVAVFGVIQSFLTLLLALFIGTVHGDRLIVFVLISSAIAVLITLAQMALCRIRYAESRMNTGCMLERRWISELLGFSGWSLFGSLANVARFQGLAFLLNVYFGPTVNAAYGIANQVNSLVS